MITTVSHFLSSGHVSCHYQMHVQSVFLFVLFSHFCILLFRHFEVLAKASINIKKQAIVPFPSAQVNNNKALVLKTVNVMENIKGRCSEFVVDVFSRILGCQMKPRLGM